MPAHTARVWLIVAVLLSAAAAPVATVPVAAQAVPGSSPPRTYWGQVALGAASAADSGFYAAGVGAAIQTRRRLWVARVSSISTKSRKRMEEAGVLMGLATRPAVIHIGGAAGLGVASDPRGSSAIALPLEAHVSWRPTRWAGLGLRLFGNVNRLTNFGGATVSLQLGRLRP